MILFGLVIVPHARQPSGFLGPDVYNHYAEAAKGNALLLWGARSVLLVALVTSHRPRGSAVRLVRHRAARGVPGQEEHRDQLRRRDHEVQRARVCCATSCSTWRTSRSRGCRSVSHEFSPVDVYGNYRGTFRCRG